MPVKQPRKPLALLKYLAVALLITGVFLLARTVKADPGDKIVFGAFGVAAVAAAWMIWPD